jgi:hypothetical protein
MLYKNVNLQAFFDLFQSAQHTYEKSSVVEL